MTCISWTRLDYRTPTQPFTDSKSRAESYPTPSLKTSVIACNASLDVVLGEIDR